jgi:hypothetical protein
MSGPRSSVHFVCRTPTKWARTNQRCWSVSGASSNTCASPPTRSTTFAFNANGDETSQSGRRSIAYNARRQTTSMFGVAATYAGPDQTERLSSGTASFRNNALGLGTKIFNGAAYYTRDPDGGLVNERLSTGTYNYVLDGLGSVAAITDSTGIAVNTYKYDL